MYTEVLSLWLTHSWTKDGLNLDMIYFPRLDIIFQHYFL